MPAARYVVQGRVQGVGYRYFVLRHAEELGLAGYARNQPTGPSRWSPKARTRRWPELEERLHEGPSFAHVSGVEREAIAERGASGFHVR